LVRTFGRQLGAAPHAYPAVAVLAVDDEHADARIPLDVARFHAARRGVEHNMLAVPVDPDDAQLRRAVRVSRRDGGEVRFFEKACLRGAQHYSSRPDESTFSGLIRTVIRCSSGDRHGYSSLPRYFFARRSICSSAPSVVISTRPLTETHSYGSPGSTTVIE